MGWKQQLERSLGFNANLVLRDALVFTVSQSNIASNIARKNPHAGERWYQALLVCQFQGYWSLIYLTLKPLLFYVIRFSDDNKGNVWVWTLGASFWCFVMDPTTLFSGYHYSGMCQSPMIKTGVPQNKGITVTNPFLETNQSCSEEWLWVNVEKILQKELGFSAQLVWQRWFGGNFGMPSYPSQVKTQGFRIQVD